MKAVLVRKGGGPEVMNVEEVPTPTPPPGFARVALKVAGLNHRDIWQRIRFSGPDPVVLGSDGAGVVEAVGDPQHQAWVGREVVVNPSLYWGGREDAPGPHFEILGVPTPGTYAEALVVPVENLAAKPAHMDFLSAGSLPLAGLTAWRALFTQGALAPGDTVLLPGIGSGVAGFALMFAKKAGARVIVTSSDESKLARAGAQGADFGADYTHDDWEQKVRDFAGPQGIDLVVDHSGEKTLPAGVRLVRNGGRVVFLGATTGRNLALPLRDVFWGQIKLIGTTMGSPRDFDAMMRFVALHKLAPEVHHVFPLGEVGAAHTLMEEGRQFGKIMLQI